MEDNKIVIHPASVELWKKVKAQAAMENRTIGEMMNVIIAKYFVL